MKRILEELIELVKDMRFGTDCGGDFNSIDCDGCKEYNICEGTYIHRAKCDELLKRLDRIVEPII